LGRAVFRNDLDVVAIVGVRCSCLCYSALSQVSDSSEHYNYDGSIE
jgi:hypothetical protein